MRNYLGLLSLLLVSCCCCWSGIKAKPLVSFGIGVQTHAQRPYTYLPGEPYYNNYYNTGYYGGAYSRYQTSGYPYAHPYPYAPHYTTGQRYGAALDAGIGALSLTPFLL